MAKELKQYHHVQLTPDFKADCEMWKFFLDNAEAVESCRPFTDFNDIQSERILDFFTDAALNDERAGVGGYFKDQWFTHFWDAEFIRRFSPGIEFMELIALVVGVLLWGEQKSLINAKVVIFCDNQSVMHMVNDLSSGNSRCMKLLCILALNCIKNNRKLKVCYVKSADNKTADALSRGDWKCGLEIV